MLDYRIHTFLTLCETNNYTKTAELLHITQPAVTQHIQYLEQYYQCRLFRRSGKTIQLTEKGRELRQLAQSLAANAQAVQRRLALPEQQKPLLRIGATKTIGEFLLPAILASYLEVHPNNRLCFTVDNTQLLLRMLDHGEIDFAVIEGFFDKKRYGYRLFRQEHFLPVTSSVKTELQRECQWSDLLSYPLFVREKGSGTRDILEQVLYENNYSLESFCEYTEINHFAVLKELVKRGLGITFVYQPVVARELASGELVPIPLAGLPISREWNIVFLKETLFEDTYQDFFRFCGKQDGKGITYPAGIG